MDDALKDYRHTVWSLSTTILDAPFFLSLEIPTEGGQAVIERESWNTPQTTVTDTEFRM